MTTDIIQRLIQEISSLPPEDRRRLKAALDTEASASSTSASSDQLTDDEYQQRLVEAGLLHEVRLRRRDQQAFERFAPVQIVGKPLSETIIEERRK